MKLLFSILCAIVFAVNAPAQSKKVPRFEDYPAPVYKGRLAPVNLKSAKGAGSFRTRLREGAKGGVNFAGQFSLVAWGCGAGCLYTAIIDLKDGAVYFPEELSGFGVWYWGDEDYDALQFKPNSRLLIMSGFPVNQADSGEPKSGFYYYEWTGKRLRLVKLVEKKREMN